MVCGLMTSHIFDIFVNCEFVMLCSLESEHFMHYLFVCMYVCLSVCLSLRPSVRL